MKDSHKDDPQENIKNNNQDGELSQEKIVPKLSKYVSKRITCPKCDKKFNKIETFRKHMNKVHGGDSGIEKYFRIERPSQFVMTRGMEYKRKISAQDLNN